MALTITEVVKAYEQRYDEFIVKGSETARFQKDGDIVNFSGKKVVKIKSLFVASGLTDYTRNGTGLDGGSKSAYGEINDMQVIWENFAVLNDRAKAFGLDREDSDESQNDVWEQTMATFMRNFVIPEYDQTNYSAIVAASSSPYNQFNAPINFSDYASALGKLPAGIKIADASIYATKARQTYNNRINTYINANKIGSSENLDLSDQSFDVTRDGNTVVVDSSLTGTSTTPGFSVLKLKDLLWEYLANIEVDRVKSVMYVSPRLYTILKQDSQITTRYKDVNDGSTSVSTKIDLIDGEVEVVQVTPSRFVETAIPTSTDGKGNGGGIDKANLGNKLAFILVTDESQIFLTDKLNKIKVTNPDTAIAEQPDSWIGTMRKRWVLAVPRFQRAKIVVGIDSTGGTATPATAPTGATFTTDDLIKIKNKASDLGRTPSALADINTALSAFIAADTVLAANVASAVLSAATPVAGVTGLSTATLTITDKTQATPKTSTLTVAFTTK